MASEGSHRCCSGGREMCGINEHGVCMAIGALNLHRDFILRQLRGSRYWGNFAAGIATAATGLLGCHRTRFGRGTDITRNNREAVREVREATEQGNALH